MDVNSCSLFSCLAGHPGSFVCQQLIFVSLDLGVRSWSGWAHTADLDTGWVLKGFWSWEPTWLNTRKLSVSYDNSDLLGFWVGPDTFWEQEVDLQQGQPYWGSTFLLPVLFWAPEVQGVCEHVILMKNKAKHFRTCKRVPFQKWAKVWEEP